MAIFVKDRIKQLVSAGGSGAVTLGAAASGFQALGASENTKVMPYLFEDGTAWEQGYGTYTHSGTSFARTLRISSSTGVALNLTGSATFTLGHTAFFGQSAINASAGARPGGRLTLLTATPVPTSDQVNITNIYYTPYLSDIITLWDGTGAWQTITFSEVALALGSMTLNRMYDVFAFLSSGALAIEILAWTNNSTRATAVTLTDGRLTKSGAKDRLLLGSFYSTNTTTTEDSARQRCLANLYNEVWRPGYAFDTTDTWSYTTQTIRAANGAALNSVNVVRCVDTHSVQAMINAGVYCASQSLGPVVGIGVDSTTVFSKSPYGTTASAFGANASGATFNLTAFYDGPLAAGFHTISWLERGGDGTCLFVGDNGGGEQHGIHVGVMA